MKMEGKMKHNRSAALLAALVLAFAGPTWAAASDNGADETLITQLQKLPNFPKIKAVHPLPEFGGKVLEVLTEGNQILYANPSGTRLISGVILEVPSAKNLTEERQNELAKIDWNALPLQDAIVFKKGEGKRKLAVFVDPNCGFCKRLEAEIDKIDNITVYYLPTSILGKDSVEKNRAIACAPNPTEAYRAWMKDGTHPPAAPETCKAEAASRNTDYAKSHGVHGTPTMYFADGSRMVGLQPASAIEERLGKAVH
jgi:thiol:disulfide interchange protein DsbC